MFVYMSTLGSERVARTHRGGEGSSVGAVPLGARYNHYVSRPSGWARRPNHQALRVAAVLLSNRKCKCKCQSGVRIRGVCGAPDHFRYYQPMG